MPRPQDLDFADRLGAAIAARRQWLEMPQAELADSLEVTASQISRYERGEDNMSALMLARVAIAMGTSPDILLGYGEAIGNDARAHLVEVTAILADPMISDTVRAMLKMEMPRRSAIARIVRAIAEEQII